VETFAEHFRKTCTSFNEDQNTRLQSIYRNRRQHYVDDPFLDKYKFDVEDIEAATAEMKRGKAAGLDELTTEHIVHSHPVLLVILAKLFNIIMYAGYVSYGFILSYTVPLPKVDTISSANVVDNYRAISISPILSKIFEQCIFKKYSKFFNSSQNQFGFKKGSSCSYAIYSVRKVVDYYVNGGSTVNVCLLDLSKAFDKMNHSALFIKLMDRLIPVQVLSILENWFAMCFFMCQVGFCLIVLLRVKDWCKTGWCTIAIFI